MKNGPYELVVAPKGYPGKRYRGRYVYEHHVVWWQHTGMTVPKGYLVHHKDENRRNNVFSNLELKKWGRHTAEHNRKRTSYTEIGCGWCGKKLRRRSSYIKELLVKSVSGKIFCSRSCGAKFQHNERRIP